MRRFIAEVLSSEYRVVTAADGLEGLSSVAVERPDLVVTDLMMPKLGGDELVRRMRANKELTQLPVLVLSARADDELRLKLLAKSVQDYLVKPFSAGELRARVRNLVTMKQTRDLLQQELASQTEDVALLTRELVLNKRTQLAARGEAVRHADPHHELSQRWPAEKDTRPISGDLYPRWSATRCLAPSSDAIVPECEGHLRRPTLW
jgi:DNA-binding response OmpR family regulator